MRRHFLHLNRGWAGVAVLMLALVARPTSLAAAQGEAGKHQWTAVSTKGEKVQVPSSGASVVAFVRPDQPQSRAALERIKAGAAGIKDIQVIVVVSGERAAQAAAEITNADPAWPVVVDPDFSASGQFRVHVWPTTVVVKSTGEPVAHLAGMSDSFAADLVDYLEFASGAIDAATLQKRLQEHEIVGDNNGGKADRHLAAATQFVESGHLDQAQAQLAQALALRPNDARLSVVLARVHLMQQQPAAALEVLDKLPSGSLPGWQLNLLRARALIALERWDEARPLLPDTLKLNPNPGEAHYLMGLVAQHDGKWQEAAEQYRKAYELASGEGRRKRGP